MDNGFNLTMDFIPGSSSQHSEDVFVSLQTIAAVISDKRFIRIDTARGETFHSKAIEGWSDMKGLIRDAYEQKPDCFSENPHNKVIPAIDKVIEQIKDAEKKNELKLALEADIIRTLARQTNILRQAQSVYDLKKWDEIGVPECNLGAGDYVPDFSESSSHQKAGKLHLYSNNLSGLLDAYKQRPEVSPPTSTTIAAQIHDLPAP